MPALLPIVFALLLAACGDGIEKKVSNNGGGSTNNGVAETNNQTSSTNNQTSSTNNQTSSTNNQTSSTNNQTSSTNNQTSSTNNQTSSTNNQTTVTNNQTTTDCAQAIATASVGGAATTDLVIEPMQTVTLSAQSSTSPNDGIIGYEWTMLSRPSGSASPLLPNNVEIASFFTDAVGIYVVELTVINDDGIPSCDEPGRVTIEAKPVDDIYLQLTWDNPTDPDQTDTYGADVDLHFLHPNGTWNNAPWDIYWNNTTADWGTPGSPDDDPTLLLEDTDGMGPEAITFDGPVAGTKYEVGVYYYSDSGFGPTYATVRIYTKGQEALALEDEYLSNTGVFWRAAAVEAAPLRVFSIDETSTGFPTSP